MWLATWVSEPHLRIAVGRTWAGLAQELTAPPAAQKCRRIRGPQAAVITYLLNAGRHPAAANSWDIPDGTSSWNFNDQALTGCSAIDVPENFFL
eukprot:6599185-Pyramimonas_sp.AAC.1